MWIKVSCDSNFISSTHQMENVEFANKHIFFLAWRLILKGDNPEKIAVHYVVYYGVTCLMISWNYEYVSLKKICRKWNYLPIIFFLNITFIYFLIILIIYGRNGFLLLPKISDLNICHSCEKFNAFYLCSAMLPLERRHYFPHSYITAPVV